MLPSGALFIVCLKSQFHWASCICPGREVTPSTRAPPALGQAEGTGRVAAGVCPGMDTLAFTQT